MAATVPAGVLVQDKWYSEKRLGGLSRFAFAITVLNLLGHAFLGFEQPWIIPFLALAVAYTTEFVGEGIDAAANGRTPRYAGSPVEILKFLLPAHISALAVGMLLYACENFAAVAFASCLAVASKYIFRVPFKGAGNRTVIRHFLNPSNFGIAITLLAFPLVGIAPPYQFTENTYGLVDWLLPLLVICTGSYLNVKATGRVPLITAWLCGFAAQAIVRAFVHDSAPFAGLMPMTGFAFILFTFYMITDPGTTPSGRRAQVAFGLGTAVAYGVFMEAHVVFGLFFALLVVTATRGGWAWVVAMRQERT
jgi:hypothetical protein